MDDEIEAKFLCPICCEVLKKPLRLTCYHRFCTYCITESLKHQPLCPVCRTSVDSIKMKEDRRLEKEISTSTVTCRPCGQIFSLLHFNTHATTCTKRKSTHKATYCPSPTHIAPNRATFKCPLCSKSNLDCAELVKHCNISHSESRKHVVCPVCSSMPWGNLDQVSSNFISHLNMRHKFEYDTYVDYEQDDDQALKAAIEASLIQN